MSEFIDKFVEIINEFYNKPLEFIKLMEKIVIKSQEIILER